MDERAGSGGGHVVAVDHQERGPVRRRGALREGHAGDDAAEEERETPRHQERRGHRRAERHGADARRDQRHARDDDGAGRVPGHPCARGETSAPAARMPGIEQIDRPESTSPIPAVEAPRLSRMSGCG
ncbi:hypothetical protein ACQYWQ_26575 [Streptomyces sp. P6-2-1]|uniref:hypothetical protein n=1 Tax=Streptomyces sp. P6-2-1 TaxID=3422591 RepID=UPI003D359CF3